jgi:predicted phage-related endonuclease
MIQERTKHLDRTIRPIPADREEWLALRRQHIGASEVAALFGAQPAYAMGVYALWLVKAGRMEPPDVTAERAAWGLRLEDAIAEAAAEREGWHILPGVYATCGGLGATLDRCIAEPTEADRAALGDAAYGPGALELKNVDWITHRERWDGEPPLHILLQLQAQLLATGYQWGAIAALVGGNELRVYRYVARPDVHNEIRRRVEEFWRSIAENRPPAPDGSDATYRALVDDAAKDETPADWSGDDEAAALAARYLELSAQIADLTRQRDEARNRLIAKLGGHRYGTAGAYRVSAVYVPEQPAREITPEMVGQKLPGRAASVRLIVKQQKETEE